jgi:hypothetical protein
MQELRKLNETCAVPSGWVDAPNAKRIDIEAIPSALDTQVAGDHYKKMGMYQPWEVLPAWLTPDQMQGYLLGTAAAYLARFNSGADGKGGMEDVKKAMHTLQYLIELSER